MKKVLKTNTGHSSFRTREGVAELLKFEMDKFYLVISGEMLMINNKTFFSKRKVDLLYNEMMMSLSDMIRMPKNNKERVEALAGMRTISIFPFRVH